MRTSGHNVKVTNVTITKIVASFLKNDKGVRAIGYQSDHVTVNAWCI